MIHFTAKQFDFLCERFRCTFRYGKGKLKSFIYAHKLDCCWSAYALFFRREVIKCVTEEVCWLHFWSLF